MRGLCSAVTLCIVLMTGICVHATENSIQLSTDPFEINKRLGRGMNILDADPLWKSREKSRFHEQHFRLIHEVGFQHMWG